MFLKNKIFYFYLVLVLFLIFQCIVAVTHSWDLECYIRASKRILNNEPLYIKEDIPYVYPPFLAFAFIPFSYLNVTFLKGLWFLINTILIYYAVVLMEKTTDKNYNKSFFLYFLSLFWTLRFIMDNYSLGQINILITFLIVLTLYFFINGKDIYAGLILGIAISIKLTPFLILFYFLCKREFRIILFTFMSLIFFLTIPSILIGLKKNLFYIFQYYNVMTNFTDTTINNQSLYITIKRLLSPIPPWNNLYVNIANLNEFQIKLITITIFGIILLFLCYLFRFRLLNRKENINFYEYSLIILCMLLLSPLSRKAHFISILIPQFYIFHYIIKNKGIPHIMLLKILLAGSFLLNTVSSEIVVIFFTFIYNVLTASVVNGTDLSDVFESYSCVTIGTLLLFVSLCIIHKDSIKKYQS